MFTFCTLLTSVILYQGLKASATQIITVVLGFFVICTGIFILQMSKVDPRELTRVDRRTTLLLQAARVEINPKSARDLERQASGNSHVSGRRSTLPYSHSRIKHTAINGADLEALADGHPSRTSEPDVLNEEDCDPHILNEDVEVGLVDPDSEEETRAVVEKTEDPGIDSLRGTFGTIGTIIRARRRASVLSQRRSLRNRTSSNGMDSHSRRGTGASAVKGGGGDVEKSDSFQREALTDSPAMNGRVLVASPLSTPSSLEARRNASVHFTESNSAPVTLERRDQDSGDPMAQAGAAVEAARARAQTLPPTLHE